MKFDIPKEWSMRMAELEDGCEIGAGLPDPELPLPWWKKLWRVLRGGK